MWDAPRLFPKTHQFSSRSTASRVVYRSCTCTAPRPRRASHDAITRLLNRLEPDPTPVWNEAEQYVERQNGLLILDDTTLDKPYAHKIELVHRHWSGKHHPVVAGINLLTLLWSNGDDAIPCDYRLFDKPVDELSKNQHFHAMLDTAKTRAFEPSYVCFDSWYSGLDNLKAIRSHGWHWFSRLKTNRQVNPDGMGNRAVSDCAIREAGNRVHLTHYGFILVFRIDTTNGDTEYWATSDLTLTMDERTLVARQIWTIETYHRGLKQFCGIERCAARKARAQRNHIGWAIRAFLRLEHHRIMTGTSWFNTKLAIIRPAIQQFLTEPETLLRGFEQATLAHKRATA